ncbi:hypothetical protein, partial [Nocardia seriolae]
SLRSHHTSNMNSSASRRTIAQTRWLVTHYSPSIVMPVECVEVLELEIEPAIVLGLVSAGLEFEHAAGELEKPCTRRGFLRLVRRIVRLVSHSSPLVD